MPICSSYKSVLTTIGYSFFLLTVNMIRKSTRTRNKDNSALREKVGHNIKLR